MKLKYLFVFVVLGTLMSCVSFTSESKVGLTKVTILYPNGDGMTFDMEYYKTNHMPMLAELFGETLKDYEIDEGKAGRTPEGAVPYLAIGYLYFDSLEIYRAEFKKHGEAIVSDIPNYTNSRPQIQISEVIK